MTSAVTARSISLGTVNEVNVAAAVVEEGGETVGEGSMGMIEETLVGVVEGNLNGEVRDIQDHLHLADAVRGNVLRTGHESQTHMCLVAADGDEMTEEDLLQ